LEIELKEADNLLVSAFSENNEAYW
jgi:hypothetical protein